MADPSELYLPELLSRLLADEDAAALRLTTCRTTATGLAGIAGWLTVDAWMGGGDVGTEVASSAITAPDRRAAFTALSHVVETAAALATPCVDLLESDNAYASAALMRQLIECEYLFEMFRQDFTSAERWWHTVSDDSWPFRPSKIRSIGGFSKEEYQQHCNASGHPNPRGRNLLRLPRSINEVRLPDDTRPRIDILQILWTDTTHHLERVWRLAARLLGEQHARFMEVRASQITTVNSALDAWHQGDRLADDQTRRLLLDSLSASTDE